MRAGSAALSNRREGLTDDSNDRDKAVGRQSTWVQSPEPGRM